MTEFRALSAGRLADSPPLTPDPPVLVGVSVSIERLRKDISLYAGLDSPVLVTGEPGTGKSLVARALHELGPRQGQFCIAVSCEAFPDTLLEVELFGCAKGSVVGASCDRRGVLDVACGGTVILENVDAMSARTQGLLGRFLASGDVQPVGTLGQGLRVHTRLIMTTTMAAENVADEFHPELSRHVAPATWRLPTLVERREDVAGLADHFAAARLGAPDRLRFALPAYGALSSYSWPGNVSQLRSVIERLAVRHEGTEIQASDLPVGIRPRSRSRRALRRPSVGEELFARVQESGESFWSAVYPLFMKREITRAHLRDLIRTALDSVRGDTSDVVLALNMPGSDREKFGRFLRRYNCDFPS